jgi:hypothetical protein
MGKIGIILGLVLVLAIVAAFVMVAFSDFPAHRAPVEKVLPDARFPK